MQILTADETLLEVAARNGLDKLNGKAVFLTYPADPLKGMSRCFKDGG